MKKYLLILFSCFTLILSACGSSDDDKTNAEETEKQTDVEQHDEDQEVNEKGSNDIYFEDGVAEIQDVKVKITDTKVIPAGEEGNEYGDVPVFAIWYEATNKSDKEIDPITAWMVIFTAIQDNDPNMVNELNVGSLPDESHLDTQMNIIKKDGTVENSVAYELDDMETPVTLIATQGIVGDEIGRQDYEIK